jgi:hypothetical protein
MNIKEKILSMLDERIKELEIGKEESFEEGGKNSPEFNYYLGAFEEARFMKEFVAIIENETDEAQR